jgi:hypothetical protein
MPRAKCQRCGHRRNILMDGCCQGCLYEELQVKISRCWAPGTTQGEKDATLAYMERLTQATGLKVQVPLPLDKVPPVPQKGPDTI